MPELITRSRNVQHALLGLTARLEAAEGQLASAEANMLALETKKVHLVKTTAVLDKLTQTIAERGVGRVEQVVSQGLQIVFGPKICMVLEKNDGARGTTYAIKIRDGEFTGSPLNSFGGGVVNVASFLLRVLMIHRFKLPKTMFLDESLNNVSRQHLPAVSGMLRTLAEDYHYDILSVTHQPELAAKAHIAYVVEGEEGEPILRRLQQGEEA